MCGAALAAADVREERKVVTVLFTDLVGFTGRSERLDPEDVRATLSPYYTRLRNEIERHGGTVEKFIGDAVMAVFGAPAAHEDDPERAVRTALAIRDAVDDLDLRTAVNTGEAQRDRVPRGGVDSGQGQGRAGAGLGGRRGAGAFRRRRRRAPPHIARRPGAGARGARRRAGALAARARAAARHARRRPGDR